MIAVRESIARESFPKGLRTEKRTSKWWCGATLLWPILASTSRTQLCQKLFRRRSAEAQQSFSPEIYKFFPSQVRVGLITPRVMSRFASVHGLQTAGGDDAANIRGILLLCIAG